ncbi:MAG: SSU ribosomal protein S17p (S11e) [Candidatus Bipolaricaulis sibiricus]|uniref:Small ribosomal subunit protein uS17 n=1 Tax=Bipolaricaulis sibiricus TaxID=2501609 RepID=A0A410FTU0_BIPS1|nr:MAG: SSU ribosomal protein S17p (S11e) [Candidatus Bipolaricaulis sibiricus]
MRRQRVGRVISNRMMKTVVVLEERLVEAPVYHKRQRRRTKYYAHDEAGQARVGDIVRIEETRPLSKLKRWRLLEVVRRAEG